MNPHAQRLQVAAQKKVRQLALPKGKAKCKAKAKSKAAPKQKAKAKPKKEGEEKGGARSKTPYGQAQSQYFEWLLGLNLYAHNMCLLGRPKHSTSNGCLVSTYVHIMSLPMRWLARLRLKQTYGDLSRVDKEYWWNHSAERVRVLMQFSGAEQSRRRYK